MEIIFDKYNFYKVQKLLGKRPGDKILDPFYIRTGIGDRPYFWNDETKKWERMSLGDVLTIHDDGSVTRTPVAEVTAA
jgi:hypothetical protein